MRVCSKLMPNNLLDYIQRGSEAWANQVLLAVLQYPDTESMLLSMLQVAMDSLGDLRILRKRSK